MSIVNDNSDDWETGIWEIGICEKCGEEYNKPRKIKDKLCFPCYMKQELDKFSRRGWWEK